MLTKEEKQTIGKVFLEKLHPSREQYRELCALADDLELELISVTNDKESV